MIPTSEHIYSIIVQSLTRQLNDHEADQLERWKSASNKNLQEYNDYISIWTQSGSMKMSHPIDQQKAQTAIQKKTGIHSGKKRWLNLVVQAAAVLVLSLLFSGIYNYLNEKKAGPNYSNNTSLPVYQEIKASYGTQTKVELADGTTVFLNSGSKLRFPQTFANQEQRKVFLNGEGYFVVTKNSKQPFIVQIDKLSVKVLGTTFNVEAYSDNQNVNIALAEGSVMLEYLSEIGKKDLMKLSPKQVATLNKSKETISKVNVSDLYKYTAWINGRIVFFGDPIQTVVNKLGKWYNVDIDIADRKLENYRFTGTFIDESLEQILHILSLTSPLIYKIEPSIKQADNTMSKRKIILKSKS